MTGLKELLRPITRGDFFSSFWEKKFLHVASDGRSTRFLDYFSLDEVDAWLGSIRTGLPDSIIIMPSAEKDAVIEKYRPQDFQVDVGYEALARGCSLVLNHMEDWPAIRGLASGLARDFHADVGVNAYLTPRNAQTFPVHTDKHDVFILQLEGCKVWRLHEFSLLQIEFPQKKHMRFPEQWYNRNKAPLLAEIELQPGDLLYIPRGMPHAAVTKELSSLHLTVSVTTLYWMGFLKAAVEVAAARYQELCKSLPPGFVDDESLISPMRSKFEQIKEEVFQHVRFEDVLSVARRNRVAFQGLPPDGHFAQIVKLSEIEAGTRLKKRNGVACLVEALFDDGRNEVAAMIFGSQQVRGPIHLMRAFEFIREARDFEVRDLPGLTEEGQKTLATRFVREGLLEFAQEEVRVPV